MIPKILESAYDIARATIAKYTRAEMNKYAHLFNKNKYE